MQTREKSHWQAILILATLCHVVFACLFLYRFPAPAISLGSLPLENVFIALSLHAGHGFSSPFGLPSGPTACLAPGYPFLIYVVTLFVGTGKAAVLSLLALQMIFSLATLLAVMFLAQREFGTHVSNIAGLLCACSTPLLLAPIWLWETSLSTLILISFLCMCQRVMWSSRFCVLAGLGCGIAALVNPALLPILLLICAWHLRAARIKAVQILVIAVLVLSPWLVRNFVVLHTFVPVRDSFGLELWLGNHPPDHPALVPKASATEMEAFLQGEIPYMRAKGTEAVQYIRTSPAPSLRETALRFIHFWAGTNSGAFGIIFTFLGAAGLMLFRSRSERWVLYAIPILLFPLPYYITHAEERYRYVLDPILVIFSAHCIVRLLELVPSKQSAKPLPFANASHSEDPVPVTPRRSSL